jgi:two-component SAPR family response regulator
MEKNDMILALAICDLLGKPVTPKEVEKAFEKAEKSLELPRNPPRDAIVSHAHSRE